MLCRDGTIQPMKVIQGIHANLLPASAVTLGMFDGVHSGHQALLQSCRRHADMLGVPAVALTYEPHPSRILRPDLPLRLLTPLPEKLERLALAAMDYTVIAEFTREFSQITADDFLSDVLSAALHPRIVVAGYRTTFGHGRAGSADVLQSFGAAHGFTIEIVPPVEVAGGPVSSSLIRQSLDDGQIELAAARLGYRYQITGVVARGDGRGHVLGVPTANMEPFPTKQIPADGVYAVDAQVSGVLHRGVMSIGNRPTFSRPHSLEVHLLDFQEDLYGQSVTVAFLTRLRGIQTFPTVDALLAQIHRDIDQARIWRDA